MIELIQGSHHFQGNLSIPGDKSISHRALMFGALAEGVTEVIGLQEGEDVKSTAQCLSQLGVKIWKSGDTTFIEGLGNRNFTNPAENLDCANSGTTMRVMMGILSGISNLKCTLVGDSSLSKRPMKRVAEPLLQMGANISLAEGNFSPVIIQGAHLHPTEYHLKIASAQMKTAFIMAAMRAEGMSKIIGEIESRDHTERLMESFGGKIFVNKDKKEILIPGPQQLKASKVMVPGDPSTAAFWVAAACLIKDSKLVLKGVSLNPTRIGFMEVLKRSGASIQYFENVSKPEPIGDIHVTYAPLSAFQVTPEEVPGLIDEVPLLAILATQCHGVSTVKGAEELRVKESDRIEAVAVNLRKMGVEIETFFDGFKIPGPQILKGATIQTFHDHRIAMAFSIAGLLVHSGTTEIEGAECAAVSYPQFYADLKRMTKF